MTNQQVNQRHILSLSRGFGGARGFARSRHTNRFGRLAFGAWIVVSVSLVSSSRAANDFAKAASYYQSGQWSAAIETFNRFLENEPDSEKRLKGQFFLAEAHLQLGNYQAAARQFSRFLRDNPDHAFAARAEFRAGEAYFLAGDVTVAQRKLEQFFYAYPDHELNAYALTYLGLCAGSTSPEASEKWLELVLQKFPSGPLSSQARWTLVALAYNRRDVLAMRNHLAALKPINVDDSQTDSHVSQQPDNSTARWLYWHALADQLKNKRLLAAQRLRRVVQTASDDALRRVATYRLAKLLLDVNQRELAKRYFLQTMQQWPASTEGELANLAIVRLCLDNQHWDEAAAQLDRFHTKHPHSPETDSAKRLRGRLMLARGQFPQAIDWFASLVQDAHAATLPVDQAISFYYLAEAYYRDGQLEQAWEVLQRIPRADLPAQLAARVDFAEAGVQLELGQPQAALSTLEQAQTAVPSDPYYDRVMWQRMRILVDLERFDAAQDLLRQWRFPDVATSRWFFQEAAFSLAEALYAHEEYAQALAIYQRVKGHAETTRQTDAAIGIAWCYLRRHQLDKARVEAETLWEPALGDRRVVDLLMALAEAYQRKHQYTQAVRIYKQIATRSDTQHRWRAVVRAASALRAETKLAESETLLRTGRNNAIEAGADDHVLDHVEYELAWLLSDTEREAEAMDLFESIHRRRSFTPYWADATYRLALHAYRSGHTDRSLAWLATILSDSDLPKSSRIRPFAQFLKAKTLLAQQRPQAALTALKPLTSSSADPLSTHTHPTVKRAAEQLKVKLQQRQPTGSTPTQPVGRRETEEVKGDS